MDRVDKILLCIMICSFIVVISLVVYSLSNLDKDEKLCEGKGFVYSNGACFDIKEGIQYHIIESEGKRYLIK